MKVLILTYYWPPAGGSGVQRWLKFVKYLRDFGIEPVVYTVKNPSYALEDSSLITEIPEGIEVIRHPIWEPNDLLNRFQRNNSQTVGFFNPNPSFFGKILRYIRANFFIPDARMFWIQPSLRFLTSYLKEHPVDAIISTGPPHSVHMIGMGLKKSCQLPWVADFRDPWTEIDYFSQLPLTAQSLKKHQRMEQTVLSAADSVLVVGDTMKKSYDALTQQCVVIPNGYDSQNDQTRSEVSLDKRFSLTHIGLMNADRNPTMVWKALSCLCEQYPDFANDLEVKFIGKVAPEVRDALANTSIKHVTFIDYVAHSAVLDYQRATQVLLLAVNRVPSAKGIVTGKVFEYLHARRPIIGIGPVDGDLASILTRTNSGTVIDFDDETTFKESILHLYQEYKKGRLQVASKNITQYHRKALTEKLAHHLRELVGQ